MGTRSVALRAELVCTELLSKKIRFDTARVGLIPRLVLYALGNYKCIDLHLHDHSQMVTYACPFSRESLELLEAFKT